MFLFTRLADRLIKPKQETLPGVGLPQKIERKKERERRKNGRWMIVAVFLLSVGASGFFWLKTELPAWWEKLFSPIVISSLPQGTYYDPSLVIEEVEKLTKGLRGDYGFWVYRLGSGKAYGDKGSQVFTAASLIKLPVMLAVYQEAEKGNLELEEYISELEAMGRRSENAAFNRMVRLLGEEKIQATIDSLGMKKTSLADNQTTPAEMSLFFQKLYKGELVFEEHQEQFLGFLTDTIYEDRIPAGIPKEVRVAHKIGTETGSFSDAGIIFAQNPFVLVIISKDAQESEANEVLPKIARAVWDFETERF